VVGEGSAAYNTYLGTSEIEYVCCWVVSGVCYLRPYGMAKSWSITWGVAAL